MTEFEVLDPTSEQKPRAWKLAPGIDSQGTHHIGLLDISKPQGDVFLDEVERCLTERGHEVSRYRKPTMTRPAVSSVVSEISETCDAAVVALAD